MCKHTVVEFWSCFVQARKQFGLVSEQNSFGKISHSIGVALPARFTVRPTGLDVSVPEQHTCIYRSASSLSLWTMLLRPAHHLQLRLWVATTHAMAARMGWPVGLDGVWLSAGYWLNGQLPQVRSRLRMALRKLAAMQKPSLRTFLAGLFRTPGCGKDVPANHQVFQVSTAQYAGLSNAILAVLSFDFLLCIHWEKKPCLD